MVAQIGNAMAPALLRGPVPDLPPSFSSETDVVNRHAAINRLAHVVDGQQAHAGGGGALHFDAQYDRPFLRSRIRCARCCRRCR